MKISCSCGTVFENSEDKFAYIRFIKKHFDCNAPEPPAVTRAREILEECGIVDVNQTPADQLRPLVELIEGVDRLKKLCGLMKEPDVIMEWVSNNKAPGWPIFRGFPVFQSGEIFHCYRVAK